jgi:sporulation protein YlmC with PRC-barrel domain
VRFEDSRSRRCDMGDLFRAGDVVGYAIHAKDGTIGKLAEFYFDDSTWAVRYAVVDVGNWLLHRKVLLSHEELGLPDVEERCIPVSVNMDQVRHSPKIETDMPIALQHQAQLHAHYGWDMYWSAEALMGSSNVDTFQPQTPVNHGGKPFDPRLRTTRIVTGHRVIAQDGPIGRVEDFLIDCSTWTIRHLVVRTDEGRLINLSPSTIKRISFEAAAVFTDYSAAS